MNSKGERNFVSDYREHGRYRRDRERYQVQMRNRKSSSDQVGRTVSCEGNSGVKENIYKMQNKTKSLKKSNSATIFRNCM